MIRMSERALSKPDGSKARLFTGIRIFDETKAGAKPAAKIAPP
jgi:hypothetical protein